MDGSPLTFAHCYISEPPSIVPFNFGQESVNEGEYAQISCIVRSGDLPLTITWSLQGDVQSNERVEGQEPGIQTAAMGSRASFLSIDSVSHRHSGEYTCLARNEAGTTSFSARLRVNGNLGGRGRGEAQENYWDCYVILVLLFVCQSHLL